MAADDGMAVRQSRTSVNIGCYSKSSRVLIATGRTKARQGRGLRPRPTSQHSLDQALLAALELGVARRTGRDINPETEPDLTCEALRLARAYQKLSLGLNPEVNSVDARRVRPDDEHRYLRIIG